MQEMNIGLQIKKFRNELSLSQEELAEKIYVSRQSVSNWENDKTYPDIKSLILLSEVFHVSLDQLVKGDIEKMKKEIDAQELIGFQKDSAILTLMMVAMLISPIPLAKLFGWWGLAVYLVIIGVGLYFALRVEKYKKKFDIQTYKEIDAFMDGKTLSEIEAARENGKRPYQKILLAICAGVAAVLVQALMVFLLK